jgi:prophage regulatory protein
MTDRARPAGDRLLPWAEVDLQVPFCRQHISRLEREGRFPTRVKVGANRIAWWESEIEAWKASLPRREADGTSVNRNAPYAPTPTRGSASKPPGGSAPRGTAPIGLPIAGLAARSTTSRSRA